jgi:hypothetical protein
VKYSFPPILHNSVADGEEVGDSLAACNIYSGRVYYYRAKTGGGGIGIDQGGEEEGAKTALKAPSRQRSRL